MNDFFDRFWFHEGLLAVYTDNWSNPDYYDHVPNLPPLLKANKEIFFGPAIRKTKGLTKEDILGTKVLWVDVDDTQKPLCTLPPTMRVFSGHGWHLYWELTEPLEDIDLIEELNKILIRDVSTADIACWNANRILRVPGTVNKKDPESPIAVYLDQEKPTAVYTPGDFYVLDKLTKQTRHKVRTGDSRGYRSRSERDWAIVTELVSAGATDELINILFELQPCGDKTKDAATNRTYLAHTVEKVRAKEPTEAAQGLEITADGYYLWGRRGKRRVSTFTYEPTLLLDGSMFDAEDALVGNVAASGYTWKGVTFTRSAFQSVQKLDRECKIAAWQWLGRDEDIRALLPFLLGVLQEKGLPRVAATPTLGLHWIKGVPYFLGDNQVLGPGQCWNGFEGPIAWLLSHKEHPQLYLKPVVTDDEIAFVRDLVPRLNEPSVLWTLLGWYAAAPLKTWFESQGYRFPVLNVVGTKGSGKTTLIQRVFMPLFGQTDPKSYDAGTTRFVTLALMGSTNGVPIAFSEFRYDAVERFLRFVLLSYDTGHDPRGRGDLTTVDYPLSAPFSLDGEDLVEDPAARERIVVAHLHPHAIAEGSDAHDAFSQLRFNIPSGFGGYYIQGLLQKLHDGDALETLNRAREAVFGAFPTKLPDRVRNNHIVTYTGVLLWCDGVGIDPPEATVLRDSINTVFDMTTGRTRTLVDSMVEDLVNACSQTTTGFRWKWSDETGILHFQLASAHSWWLASRRRQGRGALERDAIRAQLKEAQYVREPMMIENTWMYGIDLHTAQELGLDVPSALKIREMTLKF